MKFCTKCKTEKDVSEFNKKLSGLQSCCKECHKAYLKAHYQSNKDTYLIKKNQRELNYKKSFYTWLSSQRCKDCGISDIRVLEFDHLRDKKFNISDLISTGRFGSLLISELEKCEVVCANCHKIRTAERGNWYSFLDAG